MPGASRARSAGLDAADGHHLGHHSVRRRDRRLVGEAQSSVADRDRGDAGLDRRTRGVHRDPEGDRPGGSRLHRPELPGHLVVPEGLHARTGRVAGSGAARVRRPGRDPVPNHDGGLREGAQRAHREGVHERITELDDGTRGDGGHLQAFTGRRWVGHPGVSPHRADNERQDRNNQHRGCECPQPLLQMSVRHADLAIRHTGRRRRSARLALRTVTSLSSRDLAIRQAHAASPTSCCRVSPHRPIKSGASFPDPRECRLSRSSRPACASGCRPR